MGQSDMRGRLIEDKVRDKKSHIRKGCGGH